LILHEFLLSIAQSNKNITLFNFILIFFTLFVTFSLFPHKIFLNWATAIPISCKFDENKKIAQRKRSRRMNDKPLHLFISVGEESADLHASLLCRELRKQRPDINLFGFGGEKMRDAGVEILYPLPDLALIGFVEVLKHLPTIFKIKKLALQTWAERKPDAIILVDYPGFNFRLAKEAHALGIPVYYFIAPQVWAWREKRVEKMREWITHLFTIFPFEEPYFTKHQIPATYVGHPLIERIPHTLRDERSIAKHLENPLIGLLPGSRKNELRFLLPPMIAAAKIMRERHPRTRFILPLADTLPESFLATFHVPDWIEICRDTRYQHRQTITFAWTASGTATVENALLGIPMAVVYKIHPFNMFLGRRLVRILYIGMVNLIAQKGICPEFIQEQCQPDMLARFTEDLLASPDRYREMLHDLRKVREKIGESPASTRLANQLLAMIGTTP
jgi:lipid-A-disaccharide synthase